MKVTRNTGKEVCFKHIKLGECFTNSAMVLMKTLTTYDANNCIKNAVNLETGFYYFFQEEQIVTRKPNANLIIGD